MDRIQGEQKSRNAGYRNGGFSSDGCSAVEGEKNDQQDGDGGEKMQGQIEQVISFRIQLSPTIVGREAEVKKMPVLRRIKLVEPVSRRSDFVTDHNFIIVIEGGGKGVPIG